MYYLAPIPRPVAVAEEATVESPMRKHLKWKKCATGVPSGSSLTLPTITADDDIYMDPRFTMSPNLPGSAAGLFGPAGIVHPAAAAAYGLGSCNPGVVLERLGPHILRSHVSTVQSKPIPHNEGIDLEAFKRKDPREWNMDDVIGWMISVAKTRGIPVEDMNMHRFANCTGLLLSVMSPQNFMERDSAYGSLLYFEFRKLLGYESGSILDQWERLHKDDAVPGPSGLGAAGPSTAALLSTLAAATEAAALAASLHNRVMLANAGRQTEEMQRNVDGVDRQSLHQRESVIKAAGAGMGAASLGGTVDGCLAVHADPLVLKEAHTSCDRVAPLTRDQSAVALKSATDSISTLHKFNDGKIKKKINDGSFSITLSGKPRKRSQHTRGNKLWEFIRAALKDSKTCPSVVKWEDENEGVFRIVESEKLARLWGDKKNNKKMTYEKLSRAMRTYYEKQILVPVPKTGLYPKKLVYKFGPNARSWQQKDVSSCQPWTISKPSCADNKPATSSVAMGETSMADVAPKFLHNVSCTASAHPSGLMSLADVASRQLLTSMRNECSGRRDAAEDGITGAIEKTLVNAEDDEEMEDDERDTPPPLLA